MARRTHEMATVAKQIVHSSVERQETLRLVAGFETPHLSLLLTGGLMRHLRSVVGVLARVMVRSGQYLSGRRRIAFQPIGRQANGPGALPF